MVRSALTPPHGPNHTSSAPATARLAVPASSTLQLLILFLPQCTSNVMVAFAFTWILRIRPLYSK